MAVGTDAPIVDAGARTWTVPPSVTSCRAGALPLRTIGFLRRRAVAIVQRFGGALNLNVHVRALVLDGAFAVDGSVVAFHPMRHVTPTSKDSISMRAS